MSKVFLNDSPELQQFFGTEGYHRFSSLHTNCLMTDGVAYVADTYGAYWLMDLIASYKMYFGDFCVVILDKSDKAGGCSVSMYHDYSEADKEYNKANKIKSQRVPYTDFPCSLKLYVVKNSYENKFFFMLPSE